MSPLDLERHNNAMIGGDFASIGAYLHQVWVTDLCQGGIIERR